MFVISRQKQVIVCLVLMVFMGLTRGQHVLSVDHLPDASWAMFFLAGLYLTSMWVFPALFAWASLLDFFTVTWGGVSSVCISPVYGFLIPAYATLWGAGRWSAQCRHRRMLMHIVTFFGPVFIGAVAAEMISSGSFYFFSGRFEHITWAEMISRLVEYFPGSLFSLLFYASIAAFIHIASRIVSPPHVYDVQVRLSR